MESMVSAAPVELGPPTFEPVDFEHPTAHPTHSAMSSVRLIKAPGAFLKAGRLNSLERDSMFTSLPSNIGQRTVLPVRLYFTPPKNEWTLRCAGQQDRYRWLIYCSIGRPAVFLPKTRAELKAPLGMVKGRRRRA